MTGEARDGGHEITEMGLQRFEGLGPGTWDEESISLLDKWRQGDLVAGCPLFWAGPAGPDRVLGTSESGDAWDVVEYPVDSQGYAVITTQTCDIAAEGPGARHSFVDVSPVFDVSGMSENQWHDISRFRRVDCVALTSAEPDGRWICDLRISYPVSKGLLLEREPIEGWALEQDRLDFGLAVGFKKLRPAMHDIIPGEFSTSLGKHLKTGPKAAPEWRDHVEQVRVIIQGDRLRPSAAGLIIISVTQLPEEQRALWRQWDKAGKKILDAAGIDYLPMLFQEVGEMKAALYRDSLHLRLPILGRWVIW